MALKRATRPLPEETGVFWEYNTYCGTKTPVSGLADQGYLIAAESDGEHNACYMARAPFDLSHSFPSSLP